jgi:RNA polymerase sigma-70 factor (ECF subfamily)
MTSSQTDDFAADLIAETPALQRFAWRRTGRGDLVDDLVQETLLRAWTHRDKFTPGTNLSAWLYTILRNTHISYVRKAQRERVGLDEGWEQTMPSLASQDHHVALLDLVEAMDTMPEEQREVLISAGLEGRPHAEIARETGCALGTVRSRLSRARVRLHELLEHGDPGDGPNLPLAA